MNTLEEFSLEDIKLVKVFMIKLGYKFEELIEGNTLTSKMYRPDGTLSMMAKKELNK